MDILQIINGYLTEILLGLILLSLWFFEFKKTVMWNNFYYKWLSKKR